MAMGALAVMSAPSPRPSRREMLTVREAAEFLKLCERTVTYLANRRELPGCKLGGKWRFYRDDLENLPLK